ncbi:MAG: tRNA (adenosine(37)-N6)-dimethylallyltransferase MiaA [Clostridia bacterium]|nr:tRNA (adenosine(37)-N6)-dimethylallyltransferase MiaA [Clostridia bacterium]
MTNRQRIIAIAGPTAVGKTALSIALAKALDGEIISCDSMQIYRGMDIGTAKPTKAEMAEVPHHMIDVADPADNYSCADYAKEASLILADILARGKTPIFCGGTGLYLESVLYEGAYSSPEADEALRQELWAKTAEENHAALMAVDPEAAAVIHPNNRKRVIRALEIYLVSGKTKTEWDKENTRGTLREGAEIYVLTSSDREALYKRIDTRVDLMLEAGLLDEVKNLALDPMTTAGQAIGYKELNNYFAGQATLDEALDKIKQASRNYAKRQLTWWERNRHAVKIDMATMTVDEALALILDGNLWTK